MPYPKEPNKIVFINDVYPKGLTSLDVYSYYTKNKEKILKECKDHPIVMFMSFEPNTDLVVRRNIDSKPIFLNRANYDSIVSGYTLSISMETLNLTEYYVVDVDFKRRGTELELKTATKAVVNLFGRVPKIKEVRVTNSSTGFHVYGYLKRKENLNFAKKYLFDILESTFIGKYSLTRNSNVSGIVLDTTPMNRRGSITIPWSLTRSGIICSDVTNNFWKLNRGRLKISQTD